MWCWMIAKTCTHCMIMFLNVAKNSINYTFVAVFTAILGLNGFAIGQV